MNTTTNVNRGDIREGKVAKAIEKQTAKLPSDIFLWAAGASIVGSLALQLMAPKPSFFNRESRFGQLGNFVGHWAPTLLILGLYNKVVKVAGSDQNDRGGGGY